MTLAGPEIRAAKATLAAHRKAIKKARPPRVIPTAPEQRKPRKRDPAFLAFLRRQPCLFAGPDCVGAIEACHVRYSTAANPNPGLQRKSRDSRALSMCAGHHRLGPKSQHASGERRWWSDRGIDPDEVAARLYAAYQRDSS